MEETTALPDMGLADVDFGPGPFTVAAVSSLHPGRLTEPALVESIGLIDEQIAWLTSVRAQHLAELVARRGGLSDPDADAERAGRAAAALAGTDPDLRRAALAHARSSDGREREFPEWERELLSTRCAISAVEAKRRCSTAAALARRLPMTAHALAAGAVSWNHAVALADETDMLTCEQAGVVERHVLADRRAVTAGQYRFRARKHAAALAPVLDSAEVDQPRSLVAVQNQYGGVQLHAELTDEGGRIVATALDALAGRTGPADVRPIDERRADALVELCSGFLDSGRAAAWAGGVRPHLTLTGSADVLSGVSNETVTLAGSAGLGRVELDAAAARRICCDAGVSVLAHDHGRVLDLGRESRFPSAALRRLLDARDGGCRFPGCTRPAPRCHAHHVVHWAAGGPTTADNIVLVCARHHHAAHEGGWRLSFDGRTTIWTDPHGREYEGPAPLADPPNWTGPPGSDDGPLITPFRPPRSTGPWAASPEPLATQEVHSDSNADPPPF
ncbi:MAG: DUF222 domain-containing protein [Mycobacteriales bacterium]